MLYQIKHRETGAVLYEADCDSLKECVEKAVASGASLNGASLDGASLDGARLDRAWLDRARLDNCAGVIAAGCPNGWTAIGWLRDGVLVANVGCHTKTLAEGREYWADKDDRREILAALDYIEAIAKIRGWPTE